MEADGFLEKCPPGLPFLLTYITHPPIMQRVGGTPLHMYSLNYVQSIPNCVGDLFLTKKWQWLKEQPPQRFNITLKKVTSQKERILSQPLRMSGAFAVRKPLVRCMVIPTKHQRKPSRCQMTMETSRLSCNEPELHRFMKQNLGAYTAIFFFPQFFLVQVQKIWDVWSNG